MTDTSTHILLIEDNPNDVEITLRAFNKSHVGDRVRVVRDGEEALEYLFCTGRYQDRSMADVPHLILLDLKLPLVDGCEVLRSVKNDARTKHIPVVMLTASGEASDMQKCYGLGANSYIVKPLDFSVFMDAVDTLCKYWLRLNRALLF
jgi:two-component system, response regulator